MEITYCGNRKQRFFIFPASISTTFSQTSIHRSLDLLERPPPPGPVNPGIIGEKTGSERECLTRAGASLDSSRTGRMDSLLHTHNKRQSIRLLRFCTM